MAPGDPLVLLKTICGMSETRSPKDRPVSSLGITSYGAHRLTLTCDLEHSRLSCPGERAA